MELTNLAVLGDDEVRLSIKLIPTDDENYSVPENILESTNQGESMYHAYWVHDVILRWRLMVARNHTPSVNFAPYIDPTKVQLFQIFFFG